MTASPIRVTDRPWEAMREGAVLEAWPTDPPPVGERVFVFDRELNFTQHDVVSVDGRRVVIGPAVPFGVADTRSKP